MKMEAGALGRLAAQWHGPRIALTSGPVVQTFTELNETANRAGSGLRALGVAQGDRVGVLSYNRAEVVQAWLGFEKHNLVRVVLHSHFDMETHVGTLELVGATALVFDARFADAVEAHRADMRGVRHFVALGPGAPDWAVPFEDVLAQGSPEDPFLDVDEDAPCFLQLTTGTTGNPKPWIKTYRSWQAVIDHNMNHLDTFGPGVPPVEPDDVNLHFHAVQWATGFQTLYPYLVRGARTVLVDDEAFDAAGLVDALVSERATGTFMPGPFLTPVLDEVERRGGVEHRLRRMVVFFGSPDLLERTGRVLGPVWSHGFGSTEQGAVTTRLLPHEVDERAERMESVGRPGSPFFEMAIMDADGNRLPPGRIGEIAVRSAMSDGSYWGLEQKTAEALFPGGWFRPFDVGHIDEDGYLYYADRAADAIQTPAGVVYPHLVESAVLRHSSVANCGVVGLGEAGAQTVVAAVLLKPGAADGPQLGQEILAACEEGLADHERPSRVVVVDELPTVLGGAKIQRAALRDRLASA
jgi:acyl-coenzyme A synthetase/AMP-(fatty) acid ligase